MLPSIEFSTSFFAWGFAAYLLAIAIHECGHWFAARMRGFPVAGVGYGCHSPWLSFPALGTRLYVGRPLTMGLTLLLYPSFRPNRVSMAMIFLGGAVANLLTAAVVFGLFQVGFEHDFLVSLFYISAFFAIGNLVPTTFERKGLKLRSDGGTALEHWRGLSVQTTTLGEQLSQAQHLATLCEKIGSSDGTAIFNQMAAAALMELQAPEAARELLAKNPPCDLFMYQVVDGMLQFDFLLEEDPEQAMQLNESLLELASSDPAAVATLRLNETRAALLREQDAKAAAHRAAEAARESGHPDLITEADILLLQADPPEDLLAACEEILARTGPTMPRRTTEIVLCGVAAQAAVESNRPRAVELFSQGCQTLDEVVATVEDETLREGYRQHLAKYLIPAQNRLAESEALLPINSRPSSTTATHSEPRTARASSICGYVSLALVFGGLGLMINEGGNYLVYRAGVLCLFGSLALTALGFLLASASLVHRGQRRMTPGFINMLALLFLFVVATNLYQYAPWYRHAGLGWEAQEQGDQDTATRHYEIALIYLRKRDDQYELSNGLQNLADSLLRQGNPEQAEPMYAELIEVQRELEHPNWQQLAYAQAQHARSLDQLDRDDEALVAYEQALQLSRKHPELPLREFASLLDDYQKLLRQQGRSSDAEPLEATVGGIGLAQASE